MSQEHTERSTLLSTGKTTWLDDINTQTVKHTCANMEQRWKAGPLAYHQQPGVLRKGLGAADWPVKATVWWVRSAPAAHTSQSCRHAPQARTAISATTFACSQHRCRHRRLPSPGHEGAVRMSDTGCGPVHRVLLTGRHGVASALVERWGLDGGGEHMCVTEAPPSGETVLQ